MINIKFGTDGWRAIIAQEFTTDNVARVAKATADWINQISDKPAVHGIITYFNPRIIYSR